MAYSRRKIEAHIGAFLKQYKRTSRKTPDPNDRHYDRDLEKIIKKMKPEELSNLINDDEESE